MRISKKKKGGGKNGLKGTKRGKYRKKPYDPKKPRTQAEKDENFPGYEELNQLSKGIVEQGANPLMADDDELADKWGKIASDNKDTQDQIRDRLRGRKDHLLNSRSKLDSRVVTRFQQTLRDNPSFLDQLQYIVEPLIEEEDDDESNDGFNLDEKKRPLKSYTRDQVKNICGRFGLRSFREFLGELSLIQKATKGQSLINK